MADPGAKLRRSLTDTVKQIKENNNYPNLGVAFQHWAAVNILNVKDRDAASALDGAMSRDGGIDYFHKNDEGKTVTILQAKFSENADCRTSREDLSSFFSTIDRLDSSDGGSNSFKDRQSEYRQAKKEGFATKMVFAVAGELTKDNMDEIGLGKQRLPTGVEFQALGIQDLVGLIGNPSSPACTLNLVPGENFLSGGDPRKLVATIEAKELKRIHEHIGESTLFSLNPRLNLGSGNRIHKNIKDTLKHRPERLWHYNNGISAVCNRFDYDERSGTLRVDNLKIVNGCQTVTAIVSYAPPVDSRATIMMRLSEVRDEEFQKEISKNTNDQNKVHPSDRASDRDELKLLEQKFADYPGFFWERKKGQYNGLSRAGLKKYSPKKLRVISALHGAKLKLAYKLAVPHQSVQLPQDIIFEESRPSRSGSSLPFPYIFKDATPLDFIVPRIFYYCLDAIRKNASKALQGGSGRGGGEARRHKDVAALLKFDIGKYHAVAMAGKAFESMSPGDRGALEAEIAKAATAQDPATIGEFTDILEEFVAGMASCTRSALGSRDTKLSPSEYSSSALKQELMRDGAFEALHVARTDAVAVSQDSRDPLERRLSELFVLRGE